MFAAKAEPTHSATGMSVSTATISDPACCRLSVLRKLPPQAVHTRGSRRKYGQVAGYRHYRMPSESSFGVHPRPT